MVEKEKNEVTPNEITQGDCLEVLQKFPENSIDLIYLDPPFNTNKMQRGSAGEYDDRWGQTPPESSEVAKDHPDLYATLFRLHIEARYQEFNYLVFISRRIIELKRVLKETGSIYLHCDTRMNAYLRFVLDYIFEVDCFMNEIVWCYHAGGASLKHFPKKHDTLFLYGGNSDFPKQNIIKTPYRDQAGKMLHDWWEISLISSQAKERIGYPTQKPEALLERIIKASSNEKDIVLDPFCGSGTTCAVAQRLNRQYIGVDKNPQAIKITRERLGLNELELR